MPEPSTLSRHFTWDQQRSQAAISLASGATKQEAADEAGVDRTTIYNWLKYDQFSAEVDRLSLMVGIASRAERLRIAQRVVRHKSRDGMPQSDKDLLDWLKFAQSETDGSKNRLFDPGEVSETINEYVRTSADEAVKGLLKVYPDLDPERAKVIVSKSFGVEVDELSETIS